MFPPFFAALVHLHLACSSWESGCSYYLEFRSVALISHTVYTQLDELDQIFTFIRASSYCLNQAFSSFLCLHILVLAFFTSSNEVHEKHFAWKYNTR